MKTFALPVVLSLLVGAPPVLAQDAPAPEAKPVKQKVVCRRETVTGRRIASTTCHTLGEWEEIDAANAEQAKKMLDRTVSEASIGAPPRNPFTGLPQQ